MKNLITAAEVKQLTTIGQSAEAHKLEQAVPDAQLDHLSLLLGPGLLAQVLAFVADAPEPPAANLPGQQATAAQASYEQALGAWRTAKAGNALLVLLDQLKPCLAQWVVVVAWPDLLVHIDSAGVNVKTGKSEGTTRADADTINEVRDAHRARAISRGQRLVSWLDSNKAQYPAYTSTRPPATGSQPIDYFGGISL